MNDVDNMPILEMLRDILRGEDNDDDSGENKADKTHSETYSKS